MKGHIGNLIIALISQIMSLFSFRSTKWFHRENCKIESAAGENWIRHICILWTKTTMFTAKSYFLLVKPNRSVWCLGCWNIKGVRGPGGTPLESLTNKDHLDLTPLEPLLNSSQKGLIRIWVSTATTRASKSVTQLRKTIYPTLDYIFFMKH